MHYLCTLFGKKMKIEKIFLLFGLSFLHLTTFAQDDSPKVSATATYYDKNNELQTVTTISEGEAPLEVTFHANPENMGSHTPAYEWHFSKQGEEGDLFVRYEEETTYQFVDSGTYDINLVASLTDTGDTLYSAPITVTILESKLEFPNAFSPNGDEWNEEFKAKEYKSLVEFHAYIFNRGGQKLYEWTDPSEGWDGKYNGKDVKDGVYFLLVKAKGSEGHVYNIRQDINLLRGHIEATSTNQ